MKDDRGELDLTKRIEELDSSLAIALDINDRYQRENKALKKRAEEAEGENTIIKGIGQNSPEMKALQKEVEELKGQLARAKEEAAAILEQARQRSNQMIEEAKNDARQEGERLIEGAKAEIEQETNRAKEALRAQVSTLVISGAEQVLEGTVDASKHSELLDKLAAEL